MRYGVELRAFQWDEVGELVWRERDGRLYALWTDPPLDDAMLVRAGGPAASMAGARWSSWSSDPETLLRDTVDALHAATAEIAGSGVRAGWGNPEGVIWLWLPLPHAPIWLRLVERLAGDTGLPCVRTRLAWHPWDVESVARDLTDEPFD